MVLQTSSGLVHLALAAREFLVEERLQLLVLQGVLH